MAEIDIQRKSGASWVWWLVGLIVVALVAWWLIGAMNNDHDDASRSDTVALGTTAPAASGAPAADSLAAAGSPITELSALTGADVDVAGRPVTLTSVPVLRATSDRGFWIGSGDGPGQGVFVVRQNQDASYTAPDGAVGDGKRVNIYGRAHAMPADITTEATGWQVSSLDVDKLKQQHVYVAADSVRIAAP